MVLLTAAITGFSLLLIGMAASVWFILKMQKQQSTLHGTVSHLQSQLQKTQRAAVSLQGQLQVVRDHLEKVTAQTRIVSAQAQMTAARQQELEFRDMGQMTYEHASKLIRMGAGQDDLISSCGLSAAEARLFELMHRRGSESHTAA